MTTSKNKGRPAGSKNKPAVKVLAGRRARLDALKVGESEFFVGEPGQLASRLMANIAAQFRGGESVKSQGLTQSAGVAIFDGEFCRPVVKVTRLFKAPEKI